MASNTVPFLALPLPLSDVRSTGGLLNQELDAEYLLQLEQDRMLYYLRERAGLKSKRLQVTGAGMARAGN